MVSQQIEGRPGEYFINLPENKNNRKTTKHDEIIPAERDKNILQHTFVCKWFPGGFNTQRVRDVFIFRQDCRVSKKSLYQRLLENNTKNFGGFR